jgi:hypothetical protein
MTKNRSIYIAWAAFQRRQISMEPFCGFELVFLPVRRPVNRLRKAMAYLGNAWTTFSILRQRQPDVIWLQLPQVPLMWVALAYRFLVRRKPVLIADCHNAMFRPPWSEVPLGIALLSSCDIVVAHTDEMMEVAARLNIPEGKLMVVGDPPANFSANASAIPPIDLPRPWVVFPASFSEDEPIHELVAAARQTPDVSVLITGDYKNMDKLNLHETAPRNVQFLGLLPRAEFDSLLVNCDAIVAFTRLDGLQMSVCGEAIGSGKPMLISDTMTLRRLFPLGCVFVDSSNPQAIADGLRQLVMKRIPLEGQAIELRLRMQADWSNVQVKKLTNRITAIRA